MTNTEKLLQRIVDLQEKRIQADADLLSQSERRIDRTNEMICKHTDSVLKLEETMNRMLTDVGERERRMNDRFERLEQRFDNLMEIDRRLLDIIANAVKKEPQFHVSNGFK